MLLAACVAGPSVDGMEAAAKGGGLPLKNPYWYLAQGPCHEWGILEDPRISVNFSDRYGYWWSSYGWGLVDDAGTPTGALGIVNESYGSPSIFYGFRCEADGLYLTDEHEYSSGRWGSRSSSFLLDEPVLIWPWDAAPGDEWWFDTPGVVASESWDTVNYTGSLDRAALIGHMRVDRQERMETLDGPITVSVVSSTGPFGGVEELLVADGIGPVGWTWSAAYYLELDNVEIDRVAAMALAAGE